MIKEGYYNSNSGKLKKSLTKYLRGLEGLLVQTYGVDMAQSIIIEATARYPDIVSKMPYFNTSSYDALINTSSRIMALKKGMEHEGIGVEAFVCFLIESLRREANKKPRVIRHLIGKVFLSRLMRIQLKKIATSLNRNGWPTEVVSGAKEDDFIMKVCTRDCQMVNFMCAIGEEDMIPYCSAADFVMAEAFGYGLKQTSTFESGVCTFCFKRKGEVCWPEPFDNLLQGPELINKRGIK